MQLSSSLGTSDGGYLHSRGEKSPRECANTANFTSITPIRGIPEWERRSCVPRYGTYVC